MVVDDHRLFREGVISLLGRFEDMEVIGEAGDGAEALELLNRVSPDIVLMDVQMPGMGGLEATGMITKKYPKIKVIMLSMFNEDHDILNAVEKGAASYLHKNAEPEEIALAIEMCMSYGVYFNEMANRALVKNFNKRAKVAKKAESSLFNDSEHAVLVCLCEDMPNQEIADRLFLSVRTVEAIRSALYEKTKAKTLAGLVIYAIKHHIFEL
jgi:DNA-binding NarL/FixJ family response regulator